MNGTLYDERIWRDLGGKIAEALYHLLAQIPTPLKNYVLNNLMGEGDAQGSSFALTKGTPQGGSRAPGAPRNALPAVGGKGKKRQVARVVRLRVHS
jgi:hypothetical protein